MLAVLTHTYIYIYIHIHTHLHTCTKLIKMISTKLAQYICINVIVRETAKLNRTSIQCWFKTEEKKEEKKDVQQGGGGVQTETDRYIYIYI